MAYVDGTWYDDYDPYVTSGDIQSDGNYGNIDPYGPNSGYGQDTTGNMGLPPAGAVTKDASGNWLDKLGNVVGPAVAGIASAAISPYLSNLATNGYLKKTSDMLTGAGDSIRNTPVPDLMTMIPDLQQQVMQGQMSPATYQAVLAQIQGKMTGANANAAQMADSNMQGVQSNQASLLGANKALGQLDQIASNRGMSEADRAAFAAFMNQTNANTAQNRAAQLQQLQMQGNAGTGAELAARLSGVQGGANTNAAAGANMAQAAQARALQAMQAGLQGNTALNAQMFSQDTAKAQAQDQVNQFNAAAKNAINQANAQMAQQANLANFNTANQIAQANAAAANTAGQYNAGNQQASNLANFNAANTIAGKNTDIKNQNLLMPYTATQANYTNLLDRNKNAAAVDVAGGNAMTGLLNPQINRSNNAGQVAATGAGASNATGVGENILGGVAKGVGSALASKAGDWIGSLFSSDSGLKEDKETLSDEDVDGMMGNLTGYKFRYKGDKNNPDVNGVIAQDVEKGMPDSVVDTPAGKMIQKPEMMSNVLAVLANQHNRIKRIEGN